MIVIVYTIQLYIVQYLQNEFIIQSLYNNMMPGHYPSLYESHELKKKVSVHHGQDCEFMFFGKLTK